MLMRASASLVLAGLVAAVMSHISGALNSSTTILTVDFYQVLKPKATEAEAVRFGRLSGAILIVLGVIAAEVLTTHSDKPVFLYLLDAYGIVTPGMATMFLVGILWRRATHAGAIAAGILTIVLSVLFKVFYPGMPFYNRTGIVFWSCILICIVVSLLTKAPAPESLKGLIWTRDSMRLPLAEREKNRGLRNPALWWALITLIVLYFYVRYA